ncbi:MAG: FAD-binding oxidoreductase [Alphaproteobacteria bacterium]|nr:FAD-binding oxidoreductase [Alphaproteobacteria bacterium]
MIIEQLKAALSGSVVTAEEQGFDTAREALVWNGRKPARRPRLIVRAANVADVQAAVRFAAAAGLRVSPRGGGHNWSGIAQQDEIVLDLGALDTIHVDPARRVAEVGPAATNLDFVAALEPHGLAFPAGHCASVPMSGYLLGGGFGWNSGEWGMACHSVESVDLVTADGELRRASATENPDLYWAVRGAGPAFFGVVVRYRVRLQTLPRAITTSVRTYRLSDADAVARWMKAAKAVVPVNVEFTMAMSSAPPPLAGTAAKVASGIVTVFASDLAEARATLGRVAALAPEGALDVQEEIPTPFPVLYDIIGTFFPKGARYAVDAFWAEEKAADLFHGLAEAIAQAPSPRSFALGVITPSFADERPDAAFSMIGSAFGCAYAIWDEPRDDAANTAWLRRAADAVAPAVRGHYVGEADLERPERLRGCYSAEAWERLATLRDRHDPAGMFRRAGATAAAAPTQPGGAEKAA